MSETVNEQTQKDVNSTAESEKEAPVTDEAVKPAGDQTIEASDNHALKADNAKQIEKLQASVNDLQAQLNSMKNDVARAYADADNLKKRLNAEAANTMKYRAQGFVNEILPVLDNLERALATPVDEHTAAMAKGMEMIYNQLKNALRKEGVEEIDCLNKPFDPNNAQSLMSEKKEGVEANIVIEVLQKGYMLKDRLLRAALVKVSE